MPQLKSSNLNLKSIEVLYEDSDCLVINKPAGLVVHPDGRTKEPALTDWILEKYPEIKNVGEPLTLQNGETIFRPGIVHRLDRETSGALIIAKTQEMFLRLKKQFQEKEISKIYHAFVYGRVKNDEGIIDRRIGRSKNDFRQWSAQRGAKGEMREAVTEYRVLERGKDVSLVEVTPKTGRTHQIRVHFKAINYPVVCDKLYAPKRECLLGFGRTALHSRSLEFSLLDGKRVKVEAPYPKDFNGAIEVFKS